VSEIEMLAALMRFVNRAGIIGPFPGSVEMMHDDFMRSAVIDQQDKIFGDGGSVQKETRTT
jgi:hypothetical protein